MAYSTREWLHKSAVKRIFFALLRESPDVPTLDARWHCAKAIFQAGSLHHSDLLECYERKKKALRSGRYDSSGQLQFRIEEVNDNAQ